MTFFISYLKELTFPHFPKSPFGKRNPTDSLSSCWPSDFSDYYQSAFISSHSLISFVHLLAFQRMSSPGEDVGDKNSYSAGKSVNWYSQLEINLAILSKVKDAQTLFLSICPINSLSGCLRLSAHCFILLKEMLSLS